MPTEDDKETEGGEDDDHEEDSTHQDQLIDSSQSAASNGHKDAKTEAQEDAWEEPGLIRHLAREMSPPQA